MVIGTFSFNTASSIVFGAGSAAQRGSARSPPNVSGGAFCS
jgi:hypothetical protein